MDRLQIAATSQHDRFRSFRAIVSNGLAYGFAALVIITLPVWLPLITMAHLIVDSDRSYDKGECDTIQPDAKNAAIDNTSRRIAA